MRENCVVGIDVVEKPCFGPRPRRTLRRSTLCGQGLKGSSREDNRGYRTRRKRSDDQPARRRRVSPDWSA